MKLGAGWIAHSHRGILAMLSVKLIGAFTCTWRSAWSHHHQYLHRSSPSGSGWALSHSYTYWSSRANRSSAALAFDATRCLVTPTRLRRGSAGHLLHFGRICSIHLGFAARLDSLAWVEALGWAPRFPIARTDHCISPFSTWIALWPCRCTRSCKCRWPRARAADWSGHRDFIVRLLGAVDGH